MDDTEDIISLGLLEELNSEVYYKRIQSVSPDPMDLIMDSMRGIS